MPWRPSEYIRTLAQAVDAKAGYFPGHSDGVAYVLRLMVSAGNMSRERMDRLYVAAMLHDVGKLMIPDSILLAQRDLTEDEFEVIKTHSTWSARIASKISGCEDVVPWILHHHERFDGTGYPDGLRGLDIPFESRLLLVADAFHVMTSERPYRPARSRAEALEILVANSNSQFCPIATKLLVERTEVVDFPPPPPGPDPSIGRFSRRL